ncbi:tandem-95 repeat protein [Candidatus Poribacteria bacterium]
MKRSGSATLINLLVLMVFAALIVREASAEVVIFQDSFEAGQWNGLWIEDSQNDWYRSTQRAVDGSYSAEVDGSASDATLTMANPINLAGKSDPTLTFSWFIESRWDSGEYIALDVSDDGGVSWHEIGVLRGNVNTEGVWHHESVNLSAYMVSNFKIRFRAKVSKSNEDGNVDNVRIASTNDAPVALDDSYSTDEDTVLNVPDPGVLSNGTDVEGDTAILDSDVSNGTLALNADGSFTYTPNADYNGPDSFTYYANDGAADSNVATVTITVNPVNDAPVANDDSYSTDEDTVLNIPAPGVLGNDSDVDGDPLTAILDSDVSNGTLAPNADGSFTYTPNADYNGPDSFTYHANDGALNSNVSTVTITVNPVPDAPLANDDSYTTDEDIVLSVSAPGALANDTDIEGDPLTAVLDMNVSNGSLVLSADGSFDYTPALDWYGTDSFTYHANDGALNSNVSTVTITVDPVPDAPLANDDSYTTDEGTPLNISAPGVLGNDSDVDGDSLTAILDTDVSNGILSLNSDGLFSYTPDPGSNGPDSFTYHANDGALDSNVATVTITVNPVNDAPVALDDPYSTDEDTTLNIPAPGVLGNDSDVNGDPLTAILDSDVSNGTLALNADGSFTYTPNADYNGPDSFTYHANDGFADSNIATADITVGAVNDAPVAYNDAYSTDEDTPLNIAATGVLSNDTDVDGDPLTAILDSDVSNGALALNANGSFTYTPNVDCNGSDSFTYHANDGFADSNIATVDITVGAVNDAPVANDDSYSTDEDTPLNIAAPGVLGNDSDVDVGDTISAVLDSDVSNGTLALNADGSFSYTPDADYDGPDSFTYHANDGAADSNVATVTITVNPVPDAPVANDDSHTTDEGTPLNIAAPGVLGNDIDVDGDSLTAILDTDVSNGALALNADGSFSYTPDADYNGTDSFTYHANDGFADSNMATVDITVGAVNDAPVAYNDAYSTDEDIVLNVPATGVLSNDTDADGDPLTAILDSDVSNGALALNADGSFTYTPNADYNGSDSFTYYANDGAANSNIATVDITVGAVNDAPVANDDSYNTDENIVLNIPAPGVLSNDTDVDGDPLSTVLDTDVSNGTLALNADGSFTYTPNAGYNGPDSFTYHANDGAADSNTAAVSITVDPSEVAEFLDSFEAGEWSGKWVEDGQNDWFRSTQRATDGSYSAEVDGQATDATLTMANTIDLSGEADAMLTFSWYIESSWDDGEYIALDVSDDAGVNWHEIRVLRGNVNTEGVWHHESVNLSAYMVSNFRIRFRAKVSSYTEDGNVDNVKIVSGAPPSTDVVSYPFSGIKRTHRTATAPRPLNMNVLEVDLTDQDISFFVTEPNPDRTGPDNEVLARRTSTFVSEFDVQVGINGDFASTQPVIEYEARGVEGLAVSDGVEYSDDAGRPALTFTELNEPYIGRAPFLTNVYNAIGGNKMLVENGQPVDPATWDPIGGSLDLNPRTSTGISADGTKLIIIVIDGRQTGFSEGVTLPEMSGYLIEFGAYTGLNNDGGGSSTLVFKESTETDIINYPSDAAGERVVANHLGIYVGPRPASVAQADPEEHVPASNILWQNYPNPFNPETWIPFTLSVDSHVTIRIHNTSGQLVKSLELGEMAPGAYVSRNKAAYWDGRNEVGEQVSSGIYFYSIQAEGFSAVRKMLLLQ